MSSALDSAINSLPFARSLFGNDKLQQLNNKYEIFSGASEARDKKINRLSVVSEYDHAMEFSTNGGRIPNMYYHQLMYNSTSEDKDRRLKTYKTMAAYPEVKTALKEIANEMFVRDDHGEIVKGKLHDDYNEEVRSLIEKEFQSFLNIYKFKEKGRSLILDFIVEGELFWENIVSAKKPELGIIGTTRIGADRIDPLYYDIDNELIDSYILRTSKAPEYPFQVGKFSQTNASKKNAQQLIFLNDQQVTYIFNNEWEASGRKFRVPYIATAHGPYTQLSLIEDATVIYMLVRAPERLVFNIATGKMPAQASEQYLKRMMAQFWSKKSVSKTGQIENTYDAQGMQENYWFPKPDGQEGSTVTSIGGGAQTMGNLEVLNYFVQKLYKSLGVPLARLNSDTSFSDGEAITREELKFAMNIIDIQTRWACAIKRAFIVHLKLKGRKILDVAKRLNINDINVPTDKKDTAGNNVFNPMGIGQIYTDNFTTKCWEYYDILVETVRVELAKYEEHIAVNTKILIEQRNAFKTEILKLTDKLIVESSEATATLISEKRTLLEQEISDINDAILEYQNEIEDLKESGTSWWEQYKLYEEDIDIKFNEPSNFFALREKQMLTMKVDNYNSLASDEMMSKTYLQKWLLGWSDNEILQNQAMRVIDAGYRWELGQIETNGPDFREKTMQEAEGAEAEGGGEIPGFGGGGGLPSPEGGSDTNLPDFGTPSDTSSPGGDAGGNSSTPPSTAPAPTK